MKDFMKAFSMIAATGSLWGKGEGTGTGTNPSVAILECSSTP